MRINIHVPFANNLTNLYLHAIEAGKFNVALHIGYPYAFIGIAALMNHDLRWEEAGRRLELFAAGVRPLPRGPPSTTRLAQSQDRRGRRVAPTRDETMTVASLISESRRS